MSRWTVLGVVLVALAMVGTWLVFSNRDSRPRVGENADAVIFRLGPPDFDSRKSGDGEDDYRLGYTLALGTRHHLRVKDGEVIEIKYSSR